MTENELSFDGLVKSPFCTRRKLLKQLEIFNASPLETLDPQMIRYRSQKTFYEFVSFASLCGWNGGVME
ncbi:MAG: hypothetical protein JRI78_04990 [Deltaproteobacteria bacterium]|nr:hypothetical protein [Deltaproteobacteria bacterium]